MGLSLTGRLLWVSSYSKKQWKRLFWKVRAAVKKTSNGGRWRKGGSKQHLKFQYDPSSYALNFDDGVSKNVWEEQEQPITNLTQLGNNGYQIQHFNFQLLHSNPTTVVTTSSSSSTTWIYVFWVKT